MISQLRSLLHAALLTRVVAAGLGVADTDTWRMRRRRVRARAHSCVSLRPFGGFTLVEASSTWPASLVALIRGVRLKREDR